MRTIVIMIGNSDDKLSQADWAQFTDDLLFFVSGASRQIQGVWFSAPNDVYQNAAVCAEYDESEEEKLRRGIAVLANHYRQESIAILAGEVEFIG